MQRAYFLVISRNLHLTRFAVPQFNVDDPGTYCRWLAPRICDGSDGPLEVRDITRRVFNCSTIDCCPRNRTQIRITGNGREAQRLTRTASNQTKMSSPAQTDFVVDWDCHRINVV
jgi:hypothetical protein